MPSSSFTGIAPALRGAMSIGGIVRAALILGSSLVWTACGNDDSAAEPPAAGDRRDRDDLPADASTRPPADGAPADTGTGTGRRDAGPVTCTPRPVSGDVRMHFHHVHFNTTDVEAELEFFDEFFGAPPVDFCSGNDGGVTRATKTERGYFLYTKVETPPDPALNTYLEHVGWIHPSPNEELLRLVELGATLFPEGRAQCPEAFAGQMACGMGGYWFYLQAPSGARIEVARGPGPAPAGFGHVHMIMGVDLAWYATVTDNAYQGGAIDLVNHTTVALQESVLAGENIVETRGKPIDHLAYSTIDLEAARARIMAAGIAIEQDIAMQAEFGFRSFFVKDAKGIWVEIVEDSPFVP